MDLRDNLIKGCLDLQCNPCFITFFFLILCLKLIFLYFRIVLMLKIIFNIYIILMHFKTKNILETIAATLQKKLYYIE